MNIPNSMPCIGVNFEIETLDVTNSVISTTKRFAKKTLIKDESNNVIDCDWKCDNSICDASCVNDITLADKTSGNVTIMYLC